MLAVLSFFFLSPFFFLAAQAADIPQDGRFHSVMPLAGYNPTYGAFGGGGFFRRIVEGGVERTNWGFIAILTQHQRAVKTEWKGEKRISRVAQIEFRNELAKGFESNYGLGGETRVENRVDVPLWKHELEVYVPFRLARHLQLGPGIEHRARRNSPLAKGDESRQKNPIASEEFTAALGLLERADFRDNPDNPQIGWKQELHAIFVHPYGGEVRSNHVVLNLELSIFQYLKEPDLVLANNLAGGHIFGEPTYLNQFRLGGTDQLRGYFYGRFRGSSYYLEQTELRFPIYGLFSGAVFGEFGEVAKGPFQRPQVSYGGGLLIGLPPDKISKFRIDYAIGRDQRGVFVDFGYAF